MNNNLSADPAPLKRITPFHRLQLNYNLRSRVAYHWLPLHIGGNQFEVRFHWSRFGGAQNAIKAAYAFARLARKSIAPLIAEAKKPGPRLPLVGRSSHGLPSGVSLAGRDRKRVVTAVARGEVLGRVTEATLGLPRALRTGCDLRLDLQSAEYDRTAELADQVHAELTRLAAKDVRIAISANYTPKQGCRHLRTNTVSKVPAFHVAPRAADAQGRHAYEVRFGALFAASFAWAPTRAQSTLRRAEGFIADAKKLSRQYERFLHGFGALGHRQRNSELPAGISRLEGKHTTTYVARWPKVKIGQECEARRFSAARHGSDAGALAAALEARREGLESLARHRASMGARFLKKLATTATEYGAKPTRVASRQEILAALLKV